MSNYYTSVALFEELEDRDTLACVTVRSNRSGKEICGLKERKSNSLTGKRVCSGRKEV